MRLILAEKPSMGRAIAAALGVRGSGREAIRGEGVIVTWAVGHLVELAEPEEYDPALKRWSLASLPILPEEFRLRVSARTRAQFAVVKRLMNSREVREIVNACDSGREGELIFHRIYQEAGCRKPVLRLWTPSLTDAAIRKAYASMKPAAEYRGLRESAMCRQEGDWMVGINATRAQTLALRRPGKGAKGVASIGRVQTPTLALLWERDRAIRAFVPEDFWTVRGTFRVETGSYTGTHTWRGKDRKEQSRFASEEEARAVVERCRGKPARVAQVRSREERKAPPLLYDLTTLQREAGRRFGMTAEGVLAAAQGLYEAKLTTYPRTGSRHLTPAEAGKLPALLGHLAKQPAYRAFVLQIREDGADRRPLGKRFVDASKVEDHHAILPTGGVPRTLPPEQAKVYDLVVRRTLAAFFPDGIDEKTVLWTAIEKDFFKSTGRVVREPGWRAVDPPHEAKPGGKANPGGKSRAGGKAKPKAGDEEETADLPRVEEGMSARVTRLAPHKGRTTPPKPYTEADLLGAMETAGRSIEDEELREAMKDSGLGTPATRAGIIETLLRRGFVQRRRTVLEVTDAGRELIESIRDEEIKSPALTGEWEAKLARMSRGEYPRERFLAEVREFVGRFVGASSPGGAGPSPAVSRQAASPCAECGAPAGRGSGTCVRCGGGRGGARGGWSRTETAEPCPRCARPLLLREKGEGGFYACPDRGGCGFKVDRDRRSQVA